LTLTSETLANGYVKVHITGGTLTAATHRKQFSPLLQQLTMEKGSSSGCSGSSDSPTTTCSAEVAVVPHDLHRQVNFAEARPFGTDPFVVVVRRNGHWYVSAAYTALEYMRIDNRLPAADFASANAAALGADTPEEAAREMVVAVAARRWDDVFSLVPPNQLPLYDYRAALAQLLNEHALPLHVTSVAAQADMHGDHATVAVRASGTYNDGGNERTWGIGDDCAYNDVMSWCLSPSLLFVGEGPLTTSGPARVDAVRIAGRWFISPVDTVTKVLDSWIGESDQATVLADVGDYADIPPSGSLVLGREVTAPSPGGRLGPRMYTFEGTAGQQVIGASPLAKAQIEIGSELYGPDGQPLGVNVFAGEVATLPSTGRYKLMVVSIRPGQLSFTLWNAKHAPRIAFRSGSATCVRTATATVCSTGRVSGSAGVQSTASATAKTAARP
jgi:hypothetical protein